MKKLIIISLLVLFSNNVNAAPKVGKINVEKPTIEQKKTCTKQFDELDQSDQIQCLKMILSITVKNTAHDINDIYARLGDGGI